MLPYELILKGFKCTWQFVTCVGFITCVMQLSREKLQAHNGVDDNYENDQKSDLQ